MNTVSGQITSLFLKRTKFSSCWYLVSGNVYSFFLLPHNSFLSKYLSVFTAFRKKSRFLNEHIDSPFSVFSKENGKETSFLTVLSFSKTMSPFCRKNCYSEV